MKNTDDIFLMGAYETCKGTHKASEKAIMYLTQREMINLRLEERTKRKKSEESMMPLSMGGADSVANILPVLIE